MSVRLSVSNYCRSEEPREVQHVEHTSHWGGLPIFVGLFHYTLTRDSKNRHSAGERACAKLQPN